jgi:hypothetical protein
VKIGMTGRMSSLDLRKGVGVGSNQRHYSGPAAEARMDIGITTMMPADGGGQQR